MKNLYNLHIYINIVLQHLEQLYDKKSKVLLQEIK